MLSTNIASYDDYKAFLQAWVASLPKRSGKLQKLADFMKVHPSRVNRLIQGDEHPTVEQAFLLGQFMELSEAECNYFIELVNTARSSSQLYRQHQEAKLAKLRVLLAGPATMSLPERAMSLGEEKMFHSSYVYGAVWLASMVAGQNSVDLIASRLQLAPVKVLEVARFLVEVGLCKWKNEWLEPGPRMLDVLPGSDSFRSFLTAWRMQALSELNQPRSGQQFISRPMAVGDKAYEKVAELLKVFVKDVDAIIKRYPADRVCCLNIDLFTL